MKATTLAEHPQIPACLAQYVCVQYAYLHVRPNSFVSGIEVDTNIAADRCP